MRSPVVVLGAAIAFMCAWMLLLAAFLRWVGP